MCVCNWYQGCVVRPNYEVVEFQPWSGTTTALEFVTILMCYYFTPPIIPLSSGTAPTPIPNFPSSPAPSPQPNTLSPTVHCFPRGHPYTWTLPGTCSLESFITGSFMYPPASHFYAMVLSIFPPHVNRLAPLVLTGQPLIHMHLIAPIFLHLWRTFRQGSCLLIE